jgi:hypothetical protein
MITLQKYYNGQLGPVSDLYEARYTDYAMYIQFKEKFWFDREVQYLNQLKGKPYCYELIDISNTDQMIVYKYQNSNLNHLLNEDRLDGIDYKTHVKDILTDLEQQGIRKINVYPHTFFMYDGQMKISDLYGCTTEFTSVPQETLGNIINDKERFKFVDGYLDCAATYKYTLDNSKNYWPEGL